MVSWPLGAVIAPPSPTFFGGFCAFFKIFHVSLKKKSRKAVRWCASLNRSLYWLIRLIWIVFFIFLTLLDWPCLFDWLNEFIQYIISVDVCPISCISWSQISWVISPKSKYLMVADFMRYYTRIKISHAEDFMRFYARIKISHGCRFHEILHQNQDMSWL